MSSSPKYIIDLDGINKAFKKGSVKSGYSTVKSALLSLFARKKDRVELVKTTQAVKDITLRIPKGLAVGIIGRNGSGKSTLLKLITGIYKPDSGRVAVEGRMAALIELGAGFHPDFSGRENVQIAAAMYGLKNSEIKEKFNDIVKFAELDDFIDSPVRTYSSGMFMRLGFSVAVHTDPDILLVDEVLAVGDEKFQHKCKDKLAELKKEGKTLLLVSHDLGAVERWSDEVVWIDKGKIIDRGEPRRVIDAYRDFIEKGEIKDATEKTVMEGETLASAQEEKKRWGSREIEAESIAVQNIQGENSVLFHPHDQCKIKVRYRVHQQERISSDDLVVGIGIHRSDGVMAFATNTLIERKEVLFNGSSGEIEIGIPNLALLEGQYRLDFAFHRNDGYPFDYHQGAAYFTVRNREGQLGMAALQIEWPFGESKQ